ncbi:MAG TPA: M23 family metallopeptidase [Candidatus Binatia bacterium]|nr:M23 family metallopeptidase [Candidatus Binatia bacterium]
MYLARVIGFALAFLAIVDGRSFAASAEPKTKAKPIEMFQGDIVEVRIPGAGLTAVEGRMGQATISFFPNASGHYTALIGADLEAKPGLITVVIKATTVAGTQRDSQISLRIKPKAFKKESFSVAKEFEPLSQEALERIRQDREEFSRAFMTSAPERLWEGRFVLPVSSEVTSPFGYRRVINGTPRTPHSGVDLRAGLGSEVIATNHGRVVLSGDFFFSGSSLVLDHGGGLHTMYFHLSELKAKTGATVRKGDVIALSGMSGRVTGPHLHWATRLNGARVDPFELLDKVGHSESSSGMTPR